jgi:hypothetical protein
MQRKKFHLNGIGYFKRWNAQSYNKLYLEIKDSSFTDFVYAHTVVWYKLCEGRVKMLQLSVLQIRQLQDTRGPRVVTDQVSEAGTF